MQKWLITGLVLLLGLGLSYQILNNFVPNGQGKNKLSAKEELMKQPMFPGIVGVAPKAVLSLLGAQAGKPVLLEFYSKFCSDCQKMAPSIAKLEKKYPDIYTLKLDVQASDSKSQAWLKALQPQVTPTLVAILPDGTIHTSMVGFHSEAMLSETYTYLQHQLALKEGASVDEAPQKTPHNHKHVPLAGEKADGVE
jgi:thiol:disulfide interchange protein